MFLPEDKHYALDYNPEDLSDMISKLHDDLQEDKNLTEVERIKRDTRLLQREKKGVLEFNIRP